MVANRQDAWTPDDDLLLAEVTLRYIREGETQLRAFEEVAEKLGRTAAACGFRWNSTVRENYEAAIAMAKAHRQKNKLKRKNRKRLEKKAPVESLQQAVEHQTNEFAIDMDAVIQFLQQQQQLYLEALNKNQLLEEQVQKKTLEIEQLQREKQRIIEEQSESQKVNEDYLALVQIMERARKLTLLEAEEKPVFRMDANGNLERVNK